MPKSTGKYKPGAEMRRLTSLSLLIALVVVLACLGNFIKIGPVPISLTLCPIIIGAALYGPSAGALLGAVFGVVTIITGVLGWDGGTVMLLMGIHPLACVLICVAKTTAAGWLAGSVYRTVSAKRAESSGKASENSKLAVVLSGIVCPVVNTGIFIAGMLVFWRDTLASWAGGSDVVMFAITGLAGINFLVELAINMVLASAVTLIIKYAAGGRR